MSRDREEFCKVMAQEYPALNEDVQFHCALSLLMKLARCHHRFQVKFCNGEVGEGADLEVETEINAVVARYIPGCTPVFSGDPRGATVKLKVPSGRTNDWGAIGICVPTE